MEEVTLDELEETARAAIVEYLRTNDPSMKDRAVLARRMLDIIARYRRLQPASDRLTPTGNTEARCRVVPGLIMSP